MPSIGPIIAAAFVLSVGSVCAQIGSVLPEASHPVQPAANSVLSSISADGDLLGQSANPSSNRQDNSLVSTNSGHSITNGSSSSASSSTFMSSEE
ncbi:hypothetical protein EV182_001038, partial [Spiromyces aspiralis]